MLGIFAKDPTGLPVKTRLLLQAKHATHLYCACLADTVETACEVVPTPVLFLAIADGADLELQRDRVRDSLRAIGLDATIWRRLRVERQSGGDLGARLEHAFAMLGPKTFIIGSDSPSLSPSTLETALQAFGHPTKPDLILGPTPDGGFYMIGCRIPPAGLLHDIAWSTEHALADTQARADASGWCVLRWKPCPDVDVPADLDVLRQQVATLRSHGDFRTARHVESAMDALGITGGEPR